MGSSSRSARSAARARLWRGRPLALILDHVNGVPRRQSAREPADRLPELRCNIRHALRPQRNRPLLNCRRCGAGFAPQTSNQRYCSADCGRRCERKGHTAATAREKSRERPPYEHADGRDHGLQLVRGRAEVRGRRTTRSGNGCALTRRSALQPRSTGRRAVASQTQSGWPRAEVDASEPAVERWAGGGSGEDGGAVGRELVAVPSEGDERVEVVCEGEDRGVADPGWVLGRRRRP